MNGLTVCGGCSASCYSDHTMSSCIEFTKGHWNETHTLDQEWSDHTSWMTPKGLVLIDGYYNPFGPSFEMVGGWISPLSELKIDST